MNVLVLGEGAREHAIAWKLRQQGQCDHIWVHPGNSGTELNDFPSLGSHLAIDDTIKKAQEHKIKLVIIGPETLLEQGYANKFRKAGFWVVGPDQKAAQLETSKLFAKQFMASAGIPTAEFRLFQSATALNTFTPECWPWVLKLDGLAAGKGVTIAQNSEDVRNFSNKVWDEHIFGSHPHQVVAETFLKGREISYIGFCDGETFVPLESATDHKKLLDNDQGPNTGGMGAISPSPYFNLELDRKIQARIIAPFLRELKRMDLEFRGVLFVGIMVNDQGDPFVLEFNTRFGDPETQCILLRLQSSLLDLLIATATQKLNLISPIQWDPQFSVYVVACASGYPEAPEKGDPISGLESLPPTEHFFFASVRKEGDRLLTNGGRVLGVGTLGNSLETARLHAYRILSQIHWRGIHFRKDIGLNR